MVNIIIASENNIKSTALEDWFSRSLETEVNITKVKVVDENLPPQPINSGIFCCCTDRISYIEKNKSELLKENDFIISIENGLNITEDEITDQVYVRIKDIKNYSCIDSNSQDEKFINYETLDDFPEIINIIN